MKSKARTPIVEGAWKVVLKEADKSRVRKGKQDARVGAVSDVRTHDGGIVATVKTAGPERGTFQVFMPWLADYTGHSQDVAKWLARRPDWIAAHFAGDWEQDFIKFVTENQLHLFPDETTWGKLERETKCTCNDWQPVCAHVLALLFYLLSAADAEPLHVFRFVGLSIDALLDEAHRESALSFAAERRVRDQESAPSPASVAEKSALWLDDASRSNKRDLWNLMTRVETVTPNGRLIPQFIVATQENGH
ncbi:hypothetical protein [Alicyclobacillus fastidiosus]|uniref:SWIM-type domain-containing protein n=1 Tax=Alicyclobacillus fastidiosus TaxID=392011 RepID=A0ABV5ADP0_9BACL|nr:hypothetical protein [Alicyclobacillus fastidiosus]WEH08584.1 hypothetical protein PYS47_18115 [Alicyclobacillus fastidiosus]